MCVARPGPQCSDQAERAYSPRHQPRSALRWGEGAGKRGSFLSLFTFQTEPETQDGVAWGRLAGVP